MFRRRIRKYPWIKGLCCMLQLIRERRYGRFILLAAVL
jgi:hypothetical protein